MRRPATLLSTAEAGARLGVSARRVLQLIDAGRLPAMRIGGAYIVEAKDLSLVRHRPPGRPKKPSKTSRSK